MNSLRGRIANRYVTRTFVQRMQLSTLHESSTQKSTDSCASNVPPEIKVPFRIERGPIDVLLALEKTIKRDVTAPHYKYHDDPYLSPFSNKTKRTYALSKESGRKAAMWIQSEFAELFTQRLAEPEIKMFLPKAKYQKEDVSEDVLLGEIRAGSVADALTVYKLLEGKVSVDCKQALLELLCFYNNEEQIPDTLIEERWFRRATDSRERMWRGGAELEELFEFLKKQGGTAAIDAYNAMICGTAKYMNVDRAWNLFLECEEKNIPLTLDAYNSVIQLIVVLKDGSQERKELLFEIINKITNAGHTPNVQTLNSGLKLAAAINIQHVGKELAKALFSGFKQIGVEPSLASYYYALIIFCKERGARSNILHEILDEIEGKTFTMQDRNDTLFFVTAMEIARRHLHDHEIGDKINKLLLTGNNYNFIGENFKASIYYRHYMLLLLESLPFQDFMRIYDMMVPHIYTPEPIVMKDILDAVELEEPKTAQDILPRLWSQLIMFEQLERENLITMIFNLMRTKCEVPEVPSINEQCAEAAWTYWNHIMTQRKHRLQQIFWNAKILADIAILSVRGDKFDRLLEVMALMVQELKSIVGTPTSEQLEIIFAACLERGHAIGALDTLKCTVEAGYVESLAMKQKIEANIPLTPEQEIQLKGLIDSDISKISASNESIEQ